MKKDKISTLFAQYKRSKRDAMTWLFCHLYSFDSMKESETCYPSTSTLAKSGTKKRSTSAIKRYILILEEMNLIERSFPDGRSHLFHATAHGKAVFQRRTQKPKLRPKRLWINVATAVDNFPIEPLINNNKLYLNNNSYTYNVGSKVGENENSKPKFSKHNIRMLDIMVEKYTDSVGKCNKICEEIIYSVVSGRLMCQKGTGTYHKTHDAINIAIWLLKNNKWRTPNGFDESIVDEVKNMIAQQSVLCSKCGGFGKAFKNREGTTSTLCEDCYFDSFEHFESKPMKKFLWTGAIDEFESNTITKSTLKSHRFLNYRGHSLHKGLYRYKVKNGIHFIKPKDGGRWAAYTSYDWLGSMKRVENFIRGRFRALPSPKLVNL